MPNSANPHWIGPNQKSGKILQNIQRSFSAFGESEILSIYFIPKFIKKCYDEKVIRKFTKEAICEKISNDLQKSEYI
jgi:hypothetical protein